MIFHFTVLNSQARRIDRGNSRTDYISVGRADPSKVNEDLNVLIVFLKYYNSSIPQQIDSHRSCPRRRCVVLTWQNLKIAKKVRRSRGIVCRINDVTRYRSGYQEAEEEKRKGIVLKTEDIVRIGNVERLESSH